MMGEDTAKGVSGRLMPKKLTTIEQTEIIRGHTTQHSYNTIIWKFKLSTL